MITASVNVGPLVSRLRTLGHAIDVPMQDLVRDQARLFISSTGNVPGMLQVTPPFSQGVRGLAAKQQGEKAVEKNIRTVYATKSTTFARIPDPNIRRAWWKAMVAGDTEEAERLTKYLDVKVALPVKAFDGGALHRRRRSSRDGRVKGDYPEMIVTDEKALTSYIRTIQRRVGTLASGFNAAAAELGARGVPAWVTRHGSRFSSVRIETTDSSFYIILTNAVPFAQEDTNRRVHDVLGYRDAALRRAMPYIIRHAVKTAGFAAAMS